MSIFREPSSIYTSEMPSAWQPSPDILKDFARLQAEVTALGESNVALVNGLMEAKRERDEALSVLSKIAEMDTSQLASPQQCGAVALAADYLSQLEDQSVDMLIAERKASDAAHKRIHDLSIENDNLKFELAKAVQALQNYKKNG